MTAIIQRKSTAVVLIALQCGVAWADNYSTSPAGAWSQSGDALVFDSAGGGTLDSTTATQSTSTDAGLSGAVSLEKKGSGTLTVNGVHSFTGNVNVREGTLAVGDGTHDTDNPRNSALGDPLSARKILVYTNATLSITKTDIFGNAKDSTADILSDLEIRGGTLETSASTWNEFGNVLFYDATVNIADSGRVGWPGFMVSGDWLEFGSSTASPFTLSSDKGVRFGKRKPVEIRVPDITGDDNSDVVLNANVNDSDGTNWDSPTNFVKMGAGTLVFGKASSTFRRDAVISNGTLRLTAGSARIGNAASALGSTVTPHTIYIEKDATLQLMKSDLFGQFYNNPSGVCIHVRGGTLLQTTNQLTNTFGPLVLEDATLAYGSGVNSSGRWPTFGFSDVTFKGSQAYILKSVNNSYFAFGMNGMSDLRVEKIVSDGAYSAVTPDVVISNAIHDCALTWTNDEVTYGPRASTFRKTGPGVLRLANVDNTFTGDVEINEGVVTLAVKGTSYANAPKSGPLSNLMTDRTITVCGSGELYYDDKYQLCHPCADIEASLVVSNGTVRFKSGAFNAWPTVKFYDANLVYENGFGNLNIGDSDAWGLWVFRYPVTFDGTRTLSLPSKGSNARISLGYSSDHSEDEDGGLTYHHGRTEFFVKEMTGDANIDVEIGMDIQSLPYWTSSNNQGKKNDRYRCGLLKTGPGTLRLGGKFTCPEITRINAGALVFDGTLAEQQSGWGKSAMHVQSGAYLGGTGTVENVTIEAGGGFTSAIGHAGALKINGSVTLPQDRVVKVNIVCTEDPATLDTYTIPVVESAQLTGATFVPVFNGGEQLPPSLSMSVSEKNGVVYGKISKNGLVIIFK